MDQGTIKHFDERERTGSLLTDDRTEVAIDAGSLEGSGVLTLRIGQRVRFETEQRDGAPVARSLRLVTWDSEPGDSEPGDSEPGDSGPGD